MRLVLDTNVALDLVVFADPEVRGLRAAIEARAVSVVTCEACMAELRRVLAYPAFALDAPAQSRAYDWMRARSEIVALPAQSAKPALPRCRDPDDQVFLVLAWEARADHLVTKDRALLELAPRVARLGRFTVVAPQHIDGSVRSPPQIDSGKVVGRE